MDHMGPEAEWLQDRIRMFQGTSLAGLAGMALPWVATTVLRASEAASGNALLEATHAALGLTTLLVWGSGLLFTIGGGLGWWWVAIRLHRVEGNAGVLPYALSMGAVCFFFPVAATLACLSGVHLWGWE